MEWVFVVFDVIEAILLIIGALLCGDPTDVLQAILTFFPLIFSIYFISNLAFQKLRKYCKENNFSILDPPHRIHPDSNQANPNPNPIAVTQDCCVCMAEENTHAFMPCGHKCVCSGCAGVLMSSTCRCPLCNSPSTSAIRIFIP